MPSLEISKKDLEQLTGHSFKNKEELQEALWKTKTELESMEGDLLKVAQADTNRPDLLSTEGIARELRYRLGKQKKIAEYKTKKSGMVATIDPALKKIRPKAAYAVAWNVSITDELLRQLIQLQEKICLTFGQKRKEIAIGIFDWDQVHQNVRYFAANPASAFVPLDYQTKMTLSEILKEHPKGKEFAHLLNGQKKFPLLADANNEVLSFPPIINSAASGKVTEKTRNLFLDVTGFNQEKINTTLAIFCAALFDRGARIGSVEVRYGKTKLTTPVFSKKKIIFRKELLEKISGMKKTDAEWKKRFEQSGFEAVFRGNKVECHYSNLRQDILHAVDIIEDLLISEGFHAIPAEEAKLAVVGKENAESTWTDLVREACSGLGLLEILTFTLTSKEKQLQKTGLEEDVVEIANPVSTNYEIYRKNLFPELLAFLAKNKNAPYPQHLFEIGKTVEPDSTTETGVREKQKLCVVLCDRKTGFSEIKSFLQAVCLAFSWKFELQEIEHPSLESGQAGKIIIEKKEGIIGTVNPATLQRFGLETPVTVLEIEI